MGEVLHIYCHGGNDRAMTVATSVGYLPGVRSGTVIYPVARPLALLDIHWKKYDWRKHLQIAAQERPYMAAVPDIEAPDQLEPALWMAEELAPYCQRLLVIPKCRVIPSIPARIGNAPVILGYSVPTKYGGTDLLPSSFQSRPTHLLGGSPLMQRFLTRHLNVVSMDGNMAWRISMYGKWFETNGHHSRTLVQERGSEGRLLALEKSLRNLRVFWGRDSPSMSAPSLESLWLEPLE